MPMHTWLSKLELEEWKDAKDEKSILLYWYVTFKGKAYFTEEFNTLKKKSNMYGKVVFFLSFFQEQMSLVHMTACIQYINQYIWLP